MASIADVLSMPAARFHTLDAAAAWCAEWLALRAACGREGTTRLAAIFDIDATLLHDNQRIQPVCDLLELCRRLRVTPFLVTARSEEGREYTANQLHTLGVGGYKRLFMHPADAPASAAGKHKLYARERVQAHGYTVCFNAGDALHDHFYPPPAHARRALQSSSALSVFVTEDGVAHLKLLS